MIGLIYISVLIPASNMVPGSAGVIHTKGWVLRLDLIIPLYWFREEGGGVVPGSTGLVHD